MDIHTSDPRASSGIASADWHSGLKNGAHLYEAEGRLNTRSVCRLALELYCCGANALTICPDARDGTQRAASRCFRDSYPVRHH